ncbi:unnamed protein product [Arctogadus glacialis]
MLLHFLLLANLAHRWCSVFHVRGRGRAVPAVPATLITRTRQSFPIRTQHIYPSLPNILRRIVSSTYPSSPPRPFSNPALLPEFHLHRVVGCGCRLGCLLTPPTPVRASRHVDRHHLHHL